MKEEVREEMKQEVTALKSELSVRDEQLSSLRVKTRVLDSQLESQEQYSRRNCLRISGLPEEENEDVVSKTLDLFNSKMHVSPPIQLEEIDRIHRLGKKDPQRPRGVIVKFSTYRSRKRAMDARKALKPREDEDEVPLSQAIFLNECLTRERVQIMYKLRCLKKSKAIDDAWTHDGHIVLKEKTTHRIRSARTIIEAEALISSIKSS